MRAVKAGLATTSGEMQNRNLCLTPNPLGVEATR